MLDRMALFSHLPSPDAFNALEPAQRKHLIQGLVASIIEAIAAAGPSVETQPPWSTAASPSSAETRVRIVNAAPLAIPACATGVHLNMPFQPTPAARKMRQLRQCRW